MNTAYCLIREGHGYRRDAFHKGLRAAGYNVVADPPGRTDPTDLLVIWNRYFQNHDIATRAEARGTRVLVAENGFFARPSLGGMHYALALHGHNGIGTWPEGDGARWAELGVELKPWRTDGRHILVAPNRTFGMPGFSMPPEWPKAAVDALRKYTKREVRHRAHPGNDAPRIPLEEDLRDAWAVVIWTSSVGVHALCAGIPVICCAPRWIAKAATSESLAAVEAPPMPDRLRPLERLAWAQWTLDEIQSGEAFRCLLKMKT